MQTVIVNNKTQPTSGTDTNFIVQLQKLYACNKIRLVGFVCPNLFSNIPLNKQDFSFYSSTNGLISLTISQVNLTLTQLRTWLNNNQSAVIFTFTENYGILDIDTDANMWSPIGSGWQLCGYRSFYPTRDLSSNQLAETFYDLSQSKMMYVQFGNIPNNYQGGDGQVSFAIPLASKSSFGGQVLYESIQKENNQEITFGSQVLINQLQIRLLDDQYYELQTNNNNNTGMQTTMILGLYNE